MFKQVARDSSYGERLLIEKFKREINGKMRRRLMKMECSPKSIKQWYERAINLDRHCRKSRKEEEMLREKMKCEERKKKKRRKYEQRTIKEIKLLMEREIE